VLGALATEAAHRGVRRLVLEVARNNHPALALYAREGFVEIGVRSGYYRQAGGLVDAIVLARMILP
jgi:ribosomal-protein-alanine N-acetyltransferase